MLPSIVNTSSLLSAVNLSAGLTSAFLSAFTFNNANGVSFGLTNSIVTASHNALTTARASTDAIGLNTAGTNVTWTANSSGLSINAGGYAGTGFTSTTTAGTAIVGTHNTAGLSIGVPTIVTNALTTAALSNHSHGNPQLNLTNLSGTTASNSAGFTLSLSAGAIPAQLSAGFSTNGNTSGNTGLATGQLVLIGGNNVTLSGSTNGGSVSITFSGPNVGGAQTGISSVALSDTTYTSGQISFRDGNGVSWASTTGQGISLTHGLQFTSNTSAITSNALHSSASRVINVVAATNNTGGGTASLSSNVSFSAANGITFYTSAGGAIVASHNALTTARASNDAVGLNTALTAGPLAWTVNSSGISLNAGSAAGTTSGFTGGASISGSMTHNTAGLAISLSHPAWITTAMASNAATISNIRVSGGTTSNLLSAITFADSNGIAFGLNASTMTASYTVPVVSDYFSKTNTTFNGTNVSGSLTLNTAGLRVDLSVAAPGVGGGIVAYDGANSITSGTARFTNANGVTFTFNGQTISASVNTSYRASNDAIGLNTAQSNVTWTVNSSGLSLDARGYAGTATTFAGANISASMTLNSAGLNLSASVAAPGAAAEQNAINLLGANTAGNTTATGSTIGWSGVNVTLSGTNNSQVIISAPATSSLVGAAGLSVSTNGSTISIYQQYLSSYENIAGIPALSAMTWNGASISHAVAFNLPEPISASFIRIPLLMTTNSTTLATMASATATASGGLFSTVNAVVYSFGTGASSRSLLSVASGQAVFSMTQQISVTNSTQYSVSLGVSQYAEGVQTLLSTQYSISNTNYSFTTNQIATLFSSNRWLDIQFTNSLSPGPYWMIVGMSSTSSTAGAAGLTNLTNCNVRYSNHYGLSQANIFPGVMGSTNLTSGGEFGAASFSTAGGGTTSGFPASALSTLASNVRLYFQMLRSA